MDEIAKVVVESLRRMEAEAGPRPDGRQTGLWWYGGHARPELRRPKTEVEWSRRLGRQLSDAGFATRREVPYPDRPRDRCDLVSTLPDGRRVWLEVKGAWKDYWERRGAAIFRSYLLHPLIPSPAMAKSHTAALDVAKLGRLRPPHADVLAFLLVAFDTPRAPVPPDLDELERLAGLDAPPWTAWRDGWEDPRHPARGVHVRLWMRPAT